MDSCFYCDQATRAVHLNPIEKYYLQLLGRPFIIAGDMSRTLLYCGLSSRCSPLPGSWFSNDSSGIAEHLL